MHKRANMIIFACISRVCFCTVLATPHSCIVSNIKNYMQKRLRPVRMKIPLVLIRSKYQRKLPLARELFFSRFARNRTNLFKSFKSFSYLVDLYRYDLTSRTTGSARQGIPFIVIILLYIVNIITNHIGRNF